MISSVFIWWTIVNNPNICVFKTSLFSESISDICKKYFSIIFRFFGAGGVVTILILLFVGYCLDGQIIIFSWFWRLDIQNQVVGGTMLPLKVLGKDLIWSRSLSSLLIASGIPWVVDGHLFPVCLHMPVSIFPSFCKDTNHIGLGLTYMTSF